jgi:hypothetical protein
MVHQDIFQILIRSVETLETFESRTIQGTYYQYFLISPYFPQPRLADRRIIHPEQIRMVEKLQKFYGGETLPNFGESFRAERANLSRILEEYLQEEAKANSTGFANVNNILNISKKSNDVIDLDSTQLFNIETLEDICREFLPEPLGRAGKDLRADEPAPFVIDPIKNSDGNTNWSSVGGGNANWSSSNWSSSRPDRSRSGSGSDWGGGGGGWNDQNRSSSSSSSGSEWRGRERDTRRGDNNADDYGAGAFGKGKGKGGKFSGQGNEKGKGKNYNTSYSSGPRKSPSDLKPGETFRGTVRNVTEFCAFVDIGVGSAGFLHISKFGGRDIRVNMPLEVRVTDVKYSDKWRIGLELV